MNNSSETTTVQTTQTMLRDKIFKALTLWRRKLLDLTKRNKALSYKASKLASLEIVDEKPAVVFRYLCMDGKTMKFHPLLPSANPAGEQQVLFQPNETVRVETPASDVPAYDEGDFALSIDFKPYANDDLEEKHTDDILQCHCTPERLDLSLRRLEEVATTNIEEQGVNTLFIALGFLYFTESDISEEILKAPIVLLPVKLERKSARTGYLVSSDDDDPMINPTLAEYMRQNFGLAFPVMPDLSENEGYDLQGLFNSISQMIAGRSKWKVKEDICLTHFAFQKLVMYKDIERNEASFAGHRLMNQLMQKTSEDNTLGLPSAIKDMELDEEFSPETTFQVIDADSSQLRGIAAVSKGYDLVIEGPPGTGKSQTITNLISQALSQQKSVLFVSEKMAALQVVYQRLHDVGLDEFCLEMHSTKGNKKDVIADLKKTIDSTLANVPSSTVAGDKLKGMRKTLTDYAMEIHTTVNPLGISPFQAFGIFGEVFDAPRIPYPAENGNATKDDVESTVQILTDVSTTTAVLGPISSHPWRDTTKTYYGQSNLDEIEADCRTIEGDIKSIAAQIEKVCTEFSLTKLETIPQIMDLAPLAECLAISPGIPMNTLRDSQWDSIPEAVIEIIKTGKRYKNLEAKILDLYDLNILELSLSEDIAFVVKTKAGVLGFLCLLNGRYRQIIKKWRLLKKSKKNKNVRRLIQDMTVADECQKLASLISNTSKSLSTTFGRHWNGTKTDWNLLEQASKWIPRFRTLANTLNLGDNSFSLAVKGAVDVSSINNLVESAIRLPIKHNQLIIKAGWPTAYFDKSSITDIVTRIAEIHLHIDKAPQWAAFQNAIQKAVNTAASVFVNAALAGEVPFNDLVRIYKRSFYQKWLDLVIQNRPLLREFSTLTHEQRIAQFRQLDRQVLLENRANLVAKLREAAQDKLKSPDVQTGIQFLRREFAKQKRHSPLRKTIKEAETAIRAIKPCFLMSPISVSQYLDGSAPSFDVVIFDEASQLPTEDAIGVICRGKQLVVVGDPKQLPPTNFFSVQTNTSHNETEDGEMIIDDTESILEDFMGSGIPACRLKWHYRSAHESLINFSNVSFYDSDLYTFPSVMTKKEQGGLNFEYVADGCYEGKGLNKKEACTVADAIVEHAKRFPDVSLGVGTFNMRQQLAIQDEIELRRRQDPSLEPFFSRTKNESFFVKNLENIQGDERDAIFISVTYGKDSDGRLRHNFGPINGENGWRRLNVLITRARKMMRVFSSMHGDDISPANTTSRGPQLLRDFLTYAEHGRLDRTSVNTLLSTESPFEYDVMTELMKKGYLVDPQVGVAGYRIDLGIRHESLPGRYVCGIECDGVAYHSSETARDRDRLRQQVLEARGWEIVRIWSTDWFKERKQQIDRLVTNIENSRKNVIEKEESETQKRISLEAAQNAQNEAEIREKLHNGTDITIDEYIRPDVKPYAITTMVCPKTNILDTPTTVLSEAVLKIIGVEEPIHYEDVRSRLASLWRQRIGSRIEAKINEAMRHAVHNKGVVHRNNFLWCSDKITVRNRDGLQIEADRVAIEERQGAIQLILQAAGMMDLDKLITETRFVLGVVRNKTSSDAIAATIRSMIENELIGEGSSGLALRKQA